MDITNFINILSVFFIPDIIKNLLWKYFQLPYLRSPKGGCFSKSDEFSNSSIFLSDIEVYLGVAHEYIFKRKAIGTEITQYARHIGDENRYEH